MEVNVKGLGQPFQQVTGSQSKRGSQGRDEI